MSKISGNPGNRNVKPNKPQKSKGKDKAEKPKENNKPNNANQKPKGNDKPNAQAAKTNKPDQTDQKPKGNTKPEAQEAPKTKDKTNAQETKPKSYDQDLQKLGDMNKAHLNIKNKAKKAKAGEGNAETNKAKAGEGNAETNKAKAVEGNTETNKENTTAKDGAEGTTTADGTTKQGTEGTTTADGTTKQGTEGTTTADGTTATENGPKGAETGAGGNVTTEDIVNSMTPRKEVPLEGVPKNYDWANGQTSPGYGQNLEALDGFGEMGPWFAAHNVEGSQGDSKLQINGMKTMVLTKDGQWHTEEVSPDQFAGGEFGGGFANNASSGLNGNLGDGGATIGRNNAVHGWGNQRMDMSKYGGYGNVDAIVNVVDAQNNGSGELAIAAGADAWQSGAGSDSNTNGGDGDPNRSLGQGNATVLGAGESGSAVFTTNPDAVANNPPPL